MILRKVSLERRKELLQIAEEVKIQGINPAFVKSKGDTVVIETIESLYHVISMLCKDCETLENEVCNLERQKNRIKAIVEDYR